MEHNEVSPLLGAYALGALDPAERANVEEHLRGCSACQAALAGERRIVQLLFHAAPVVEPPVDLKRRLMARIEALQAGDLARERGRLSPEPARRSLWRWLLGERRAYSLVASVAVVAALLVGWSAYGTFRFNDLAERNREQSALVDELLQRNDQLANTVQNQWRAIALATNPNVEAVSFRGSAVSPQTRGSFLVDKSEQQAVLMVVDLAPPARGEVYQVWMWNQGGGEVVTMGTFRTWGDGYGLWRVQSELPLEKYQYFGVSREPEGGSRAPTTPMLVAQENPVVTR